MPEGPEIRLAADRIAEVLVGRTIETASFAFADLKPFERRVTGATVTAIDTRGKAMLTRFDNDLTLYSHNQLYGRWYTCRRDEPPKTRRSLRVALHTKTHSALLFSASDVEILTPESIDAHPFLKRIGPDILDESLAPAEVARRLSSARFRNRGLGGLYLDQACLAGIGNYLRSEILFSAGVHPARRPSGLDRRALQRLARETLKISRRSYETRGVTVSKALAASLERKGLSYRQYRHWVFGREGRPCHRCEADIVRMAVSSRSLFYCPRCQPLEP